MITSSKVSNRSDRPSVHVLPTVVISTVDLDLTNSEELLQLVQDVHAPFALSHDELRLNLPTQARRGVPEERNAEAALAVDEPDDPLLESWPFLLIVRTERIVTRHAATLDVRSDMTGSVGFSEFPAYSQLLTMESPPWRAV